MSAIYTKIKIWEITNILIGVPRLLLDRTHELSYQVVGAVSSREIKDLSPLASRLEAAPTGNNEQHVAEIP